MRLAFVLLVVLIVGCATGPSREAAAVRAYSEENFPKLERGELKRSAYYAELYNLESRAGAPGWVLRMSNQFIDNAKALEAGMMTRDEYESRRRALLADAQTMREADDATYRAQQAQQQALGAQQVAAGLAMMQGGGPRPIGGNSYAPAYLRSQQVSGSLRYCTYSNGTVQTVTSRTACPSNN